ncbi:MAG: hypothetical protein ACQEXJ_21390 [Myxococcota bacterium]
MSRSIPLGALLLVLVLGASAPAVRADTVSVYAGAGPRWRPDTVEAVGTTQLSWSTGDWSDVSLALHGFLGGPGEGPVDFAGGSLAFHLRPPIPGPIGVEAGVGAGFLDRTLRRHGVEDNLLVLSAEAAVTGSLGPAKLRLSWQRALGREDGEAARSWGSQVMLMLGFGI